MIYELAKTEDLKTICDVVQHTIKTVYPKYYPKEVVDFFCELHSIDAIIKDIEIVFFTIKHERYQVENGVILAYEIMEKELHKASTEINYDGRKFVPKMNSQNGEVSEQTIFTYHQNENLLWAEYSGGDILKGFLIGMISDKGELDFVYQHMNRDMQVKTGKCHSVPDILENGKIELSEQWEWTSGDYSKGESLLVEV